MEDEWEEYSAVLFCNEGNLDGNVFASEMSSYQWEIRKDLIYVAFGVTPFFLFLALPIKSAV